MSKECIYVIAANSQVCQIYEYRHPLIKPIVRLSHASQGPLLHDEPQQHKKPASQHDAHQKPTLKDLKMSYFAAEIGDFLEQALHHHAFDKLLLIIPPHDEPLVEQAFSHHIRNKIDHVILKDIDITNEMEVASLIHAHLY